MKLPVKLVSVEPLIILEAQESVQHLKPDLYAKLVVSNPNFDEKDLRLVVDEKKKLIRKSGLLEYYGYSEDMESVGGLDSLKLWLRQRGLAFSQKARDFGLPEPKGLLLLGVQGCERTFWPKSKKPLRCQLPARNSSMISEPGPRGVPARQHDE